jgi:dipeptidyl aminopeptidase/acylaminoacyl peptidase
MSISAGTNVGGFEILGPLGQGGMGEVYRARDPRLGRDVALKVLPADMAANRDAVHRFEQEARAASALNHPNIVTIHGIGQTESTLYIAMELVEGKTLRELLRSGPLSVKKAIEIGAQIASGLAKAHAAGITHRDLKPENVMVSRDGYVKILDFGLAKLAVAPLFRSPAAEDGTIPDQTRPGVILGTAGYMSPEQIRGGTVDLRSDVFGLGSILYEMLSGERAFQGESSIETMNAILKDDPPELSSVGERIAPALDRLVRHCLEKNPDDRFQSSRDLAFDLESISRGSLSSSAISAAIPAGRPRWPAAARWSAAIAVGLAAGALLATRLRENAPPVFHQLTFRHGTIQHARFAPDGQTIVCGGSWEGRPVEIHFIRPDSPESRPLGIASADVLSVSRDGQMAISLDRRYVGGFTFTGTLARASLGGGAPRPILEDIEEADWAPDGKAMAVVDASGGRERLQFPIGRSIYETAGYISDIRISPDGDRVAFVDHPVNLDNAGSIAVVDRRGTRRTLSGGWSSAEGLAWRPDGREIWFTATRTGAARSLYGVTLGGRDRLIWRVPGRLTLQDISGGGRVLLTHDTRGKGVVGLPTGEAKGRDLSWLDWSRAMDLSPDGSTILFDETGEGGGPNYSVYIRKVDDSPAVRLGEGIAQALSPDGKWAMCIVTHSSPQQLVLLPTGAGQPRPLTHDSVNHVAAGWMPDGAGIFFAGNEPGHGSRLWVQDLRNGPARAISEEGVGATWNAISPDGRWIAATGPDRRISLYPVAEGRRKPLAGVASGDVPIRFSEDGSALYVRRSGELPVRIFRVGLARGDRSIWREVDLSDPAGILTVAPILLSRDGKTVVYTYFRVLSDLYLVDGLK